MPEPNPRIFLGDLDDHEFALFLGKLANRLSARKTDFYVKT